MNIADEPTMDNAEITIGESPGLGVTRTEKDKVEVAPKTSERAAPEKNEEHKRRRRKSRPSAVIAAAGTVPQSQP